MKKIIYLLILACFFSCKPDKSSSNENTIRLRLKWLHQSQFAGFYAAYQKGFYKSKNLDVIINPGGLDYPAIDLVLNGADDFGIAGADQVLKAINSGKALKVIGVIYKQTPFCLFSWKENNINSFADLKSNDIIGVKYGGNEEFTYRAMISEASKRKENVIFATKNNEVKFINESPVKYDLGPFYTNEITLWPGYLINEPYLARTQQSRDVNLLLPEKYDINIYADVIFTSNNFIEKHPQKVKDFMSATQKGWNYALNDINEEEVVNYVLRYAIWSNYNHEKYMLNSSKRLVLGEKNNVLIMEIESWQNLSNILEEYTDFELIIPLESVYTNEFIQKN